MVRCVSKVKKKNEKIIILIRKLGLGKRQQFPMLKKQITYTIPNIFSVVNVFKYKNKAVKQSWIERVATDHLNTFELHPHLYKNNYP